MSAGNVDEFMESVAHSRKEEVHAIRELIRAAVPSLSEQIKWNAPSFGIDSDDRITFRLQPGDRVQLIFHRGVKKRDDIESFVFDDESGFLEWSTNDRAVVTFENRGDVGKKTFAFQRLVKHWIDATTDQ